MGTENRLLMNTLIAALEAGGDALMSNFGRVTEIRRKSPIDLVTNADRESEKVITNLIQSAFPTHEILAEEGGRIKGSEYLWLIDPLDGTTNYAHGFPMFSVSIALQHEGEVIAAGVFNPYFKELFLGEKGKGATLNGARIGVSSIGNLADALMVSGFPYDRRERVHHYLKGWELMLLKAQGMLRLGSAALDMCYVACGRVEAYWEESLQPWDTAAGFLIVEEAGGIVSDFAGKRFNPFDKQVLASNGVIHSATLAVLEDRARATAETNPG